MEPWGIDQKATEEAREPLSQGEVSSSEGTKPGMERGRKDRPQRLKPKSYPAPCSTAQAVSRAICGWLGEVG